MPPAAFVDQRNTATGKLPKEPNTLDGVTARAAELNLLDGQPAEAVFTIAVQAGDVKEVSIQLNDANGDPLERVAAFDLYLSDDAAGAGLTATAPDGGIAATTGEVIPKSGTPLNALLVNGDIAITAAQAKFKTTQIIAALIGGVLVTKAPADNLVFSAAHRVTASKFGAIRLQMDAAGAISSKVVASPQAYALGDAGAAAIAALPAADAGKVSIGYILIENDAGDWDANTHELDATDCTAATFVDETEDVVGPAKSFEVITDATGLAVLELTESGAGTWYAAARLPNSVVDPSGAITFA